MSRRARSPGSPARTDAARATAARWSGSATAAASAKVDFALSRAGAVDERGRCARAGTVHLGGTRQEVAAAENARQPRAAAAIALRAGRPAVAVRRRRARPPAGTRSGPTRTCRPGRPPIAGRRSSGRSSASPRDSATRSSPRPRATRWTSSATTRTTSAATSRRAHRSWRSCSAAPCSAPTRGARPFRACTCPRRR